MNKKKLIFLSIGGLLSCGALTLSMVSLSLNYSFDKAKGSEDYYSITVLAGDITTTSHYCGGYATVKTDQLQNDVSLKYENVQYSSAEGLLYLQTNGDGVVYNPYEENGENEIRGMNSITIFGDSNPFTIKWGYEVGGEISYTDSYWGYMNASGTEVSFNGDKPNYFRIESGNNYTTSGLSKIVITYGKDCESGANPNFVKDGIKYKDRGTYYEVIGFENSSIADLTFPATINDVPVTHIADRAFEGDTTITSLNLTGTNITHIGEYAFSTCSNLATLSGEDQLVSIKSNAFNYVGLTNTSLTFGDDLEFIGSAAFYGLRNCKSVSFSDSCSPQIETSIFNWAYDIETCHIGRNMDNGYPVFYGVPSFKEYTTTDTSGKYYAVDGVLYNQIGEAKYAMKMPTAWDGEDYVVPAGLTEVSYEFAEDVDTLKTVSYAISGLDRTGSNAFEGCDNLEAVTLCNSITRLDYECFYNCPKLASITLHEGIRFLDTECLSKTALTSINLPSTIENLYYGCFKDCTSLATITYAGTVAQFDSIYKGEDCFKNVAATEIVCSDGNIAL